MRPNQEGMECWIDAAHASVRDRRDEPRGGGDHARDFIHPGPFHPYRHFQDRLGDLPIYHQELSRKLLMNAQALHVLFQGYLI